MVLRFAHYFARWRRKAATLRGHGATVAIRRISVLARVTLGASTAILLASLNSKVHGDAAPSARDPGRTQRNPGREERLRLLADPKGGNKVVHIVNPRPVGIEDVSYFAHHDVRIRILEFTRVVHINICDGGLLSMADSILKHEKVLLGELYRWHYKSNGHNHRDPKPVEFMGNPHPPPTFVKASLKAAVEFFRPKASREDSVTTPPQSLLTAFYDVDVQLLHVATLGNIRALLGRPQTPIGGSVKYDVHVLSAHDNPDPDEESHTKAGADITSTIKIRQGDFLVMLTPWISKCLTNEEVVGLVGIWLAKNRPIEGDEAAPSASTTGILPEELPVDLKDDETLMFRRWGVPKRFINEDAEVATHLVHNAMGGADKRLRELLLGFEAQDSGGTTESFAVAIILFK